MDIADIWYGNFENTEDKTQHTTNNHNMKAKNIKVERVTKDVSCTVVTDYGDEFIICGEIVNGDMDENKIGPVFDQKDKFEELCDEVKTEIIEFAFNTFRFLI